MRRKVKLKDLGIQFIVPMRDKPKVFGGTIPWCRIEDIQGKYINGTLSQKLVSEKTISEMNLKVLPKNSLIYSCSATIGVAAINTVELCTNQTFIGLIPSKEVNVDFLYYYLSSFKDSLKKIASQTTIPYISREKFENLEINTPIFDIQKKIGIVLSTLDDKIELNNKINAKLEATAKTLYDYWFVQFDFPDANGKPYRSSGGRMIYNEKLKREIPEEWEVENITNYCDIIDCLHSKKPDCQFEDDKLFLLQLENILDNGLVDISNKYHVSKKDYIAWTSRIEVEDNDILVTNAGRVAAIAQMPNNLKAGIGRNITAIRPKSISPTYLALSFKGFDIQKQIKCNTDNGAFFQSFNVKGIKKLNLVKAPHNIETNFEKIVLYLRRKREDLLTENQQLASLRNWLLPMLMNGQVGFKDEIEPQTKASDKQIECFQKIQSLYSIIYANNELGIQQGEMAIAKDLYLVDRIGGVNTGFNFAQHNWGSFDPTEKQIINNKQYFIKKNYPNSKAIYYDLKDGGELLSKISMELKAPIKQTIQTLHQKVFSNFQRTAKAEEKELYATVLKCIEDTQSIDLSQIREEMKRWKTPKQQFPDKAAKFSEERTRVVLDTIVREGWHKNVMK